MLTHCTPLYRSYFSISCLIAHDGPETDDDIENIDDTEESVMTVGFPNHGIFMDLQCWRRIKNRNIALDMEVSLDLLFIAHRHFGKL